MLDILQLSFLSLFTFSFVSISACWWLRVKICFYEVNIRIWYGNFYKNKWCKEDSEKVKSPESPLKEFEHKETPKKLQRNRKETAKKPQRPQRNCKIIPKRLQRYCNEATKKPKETAKKLDRNCIETTDTLMIHKYCWWVWKTNYCLTFKFSLCLFKIK